MSARRAIRSQQRVARLSLSATGGRVQPWLDVAPRLASLRDVNRATRIRRVVPERVSARRAVRSAQTSPRRAVRSAQTKKGSQRVLPVGIHKRRQRPTFPLSSIIGGRSLTTVFGMGTGVASHLWSPTNPAAGLHRRPVVFVVSQTSRTERINALGDKGRQPDLVLNAAS